MEINIYLLSLKRSSGEVEEVTDTYEEEDVPLRPIPFQPRPFYPQIPPRSNGFPIRVSVFISSYT